MTDEFSNPASAEGIKWTDIKGSLVLFKVNSIEHAIPTVHGESDAVSATVTVLDGDQEGAVYTDTLVFPKVLQSQLKGNVGGMVLGRLGQGEAKKGQSAPWKLTDPEDADKDVARAYLNAQQKTPF